MTRVFLNRRRWTRPRRHVSLGDLRRVTPIARGFGFDRGLPVDRFYIEAFLERNALAINGAVLEIGDDTYTRRFGSDVTTSDVLHVTSGRPKTTVVADLTAAGHIADNSFDCIICTQTLQLIFDVPAAIATLYRILKPGGVVLATVPGISQIDDREWATTWFWSFTELAAKRLFAELFGRDYVEVEGHGNVLAAVAFLHGLAAEELEEEELRARDPAYPLLVTVKAVKESSATIEKVPDVSIIIPCFNQSHFLGEAIESALAQSHRPVEVVVVDDGSGDNTSEVAGRYAGISYVRQPNAGLAAARNTGISRSHGEYVVFLDADDRLRPDAVSRGLSVLAARPECAFVSGHHQLIGVDGTVIQEWVRPPAEGDRYAQLLRGNYVSMCAAVLFRRAALTAVGGFNASLSASEDYDLYLRVARRFPICDHETVVAEYRRHGGAITDDPLRMLRSVLRVLKAQKPYIRHNHTHVVAWRAGLRHWRSYYGRASAEWLLERRQDGDNRWTILTDAVALARLAPAECVQIWPRLVAPPLRLDVSRHP